MTLNNLKHTVNDLSCFGKKIIYKLRGKRPSC